MFPNPNFEGTPLQCDNPDGPCACGAWHITPDKKVLIETLRELYAYTIKLEGKYSTWVSSRPSMASYPEGAKEIGERVRRVLGIDKEDQT